MIQALQPLVEIPGVRVVMLVTPDGVPIAIPTSGASGAPQGDPGSQPESLDHGPLGQEDAVAAIATGWLAEAESHVAPLSWNAPQRIVLRAARGTLVLQRTRTAILLVILARGMDPEDVRLSMDGTIARIERGLRNMGVEDAAPDRTSSVAPPFVGLEEAMGPEQGSAGSSPAGPLPSRSDSVSPPSISMDDLAGANPFDRQDTNGQ